MYFSPQTFVLVCVWTWQLYLSASAGFAEGGEGEEVSGAKLQHPHCSHLQQVCLQPVLRCCPLLATATPVSLLSLYMSIEKGVPASALTSSGKKRHLILEAWGVRVQLWRVEAIEIL